MSIQYLVTPNQSALPALVGYHSLGLRIQGLVFKLLLFGLLFSAAALLLHQIVIWKEVCVDFFSQIGNAGSFTHAGSCPVSNLRFESSSTLLF